MKIKINELRKLSNILFDILEQKGERCVEIDADYYWTLYDANEIFDPYEKPSKIG
jgi:hypothetical protein